MKIVVVSTPIFQTPVTGYAGLEVVAYEQAKGLAALGHEVALVAPDGSTCPNVQIIPCGPAGHVDEKSAFGGFGELKDDKGNVLRRAHPGYWQALVHADAVICHDWQKWAYSLKAEGALQAPVLGWFHAPVNTMYGQWPPTYPRQPPVEKACPVCISEDQANHFRALHNRPARVCYNGIDPEHYKPIPGIKRTDRFLFLARFSTIKGPALAIEACLAAGVGLDLVGDTTITGEPQYLEHCLKLAEQTSPNWDRSKGKQIVVHGGCSRGETVMWFSKAHAMIHPNRDFREPFGLAPVEAMACGCPVIAWNNGAMRETVGAGCGWLVSSVESLTEAIGQGVPKLLPETIRQRCRDNALKFTVDNMVKRCEELCREAVDSGGW